VNNQPVICAIFKRGQKSDPENIKYSVAYPDFDKIQPAASLQQESGVLNDQIAS